MGQYEILLVTQKLVMHSLICIAKITLPIWYRTPRCAVGLGTVKFQVIMLWHGVSSFLV